jgi:hypothetical protein
VIRLPVLPVLAGDPPAGAAGAAGAGRCCRCWPVLAAGRWPLAAGRWPHNTTYAGHLSPWHFSDTKKRAAVVSRAPRVCRRFDPRLCDQIAAPNLPSHARVFVARLAHSQQIENRFDGDLICADSAAITVTRD